MSTELSLLPTVKHAGSKRWTQVELLATIDNGSEFLCEFCSFVSDFFGTLKF